LPEGLLRDFQRVLQEVWQRLLQASQREVRGNLLQRALTRCFRKSTMENSVLSLHGQYLFKDSCGFFITMRTTLNELACSNDREGGINH
jgi:hypothetical protein